MPQIIQVLKDSAGNALSGLAKAATFNSEALVPKGKTLGLVVDIGTVTGTSPTLDIKAQMSLNNGTTWLDTYPAAANAETQWTLAQITAAKETSEFVPGWLPQIGGAGSTIDPVVRFVFTIGGTNPSFPLTNVWYVWRDIDA